MSKSKRFEFYSDEKLIGVLDTVTGKTFNSFEIVDCLNEQQDNINQQKETIDYMNERITELLAYIKHLKNGTERVKEIDGKIFIKM